MAATRSRIGGFPALADLELTLRYGEVNPVGMALLGSLGIEGDGYGEGGVVVTPGPRIAGQMGSVGLGDGVTAGVLAML